MQARQRCADPRILSPPPSVDSHLRFAFATAFAIVCMQSRIHSPSASAVSTTMWISSSSQANSLYRPNYLYTVSGKKSLQFFMCNFNKFEVIFIIFGTNHTHLRLHFTKILENFSTYISMSLFSADVIVTSSKMPLLLYPG